MSRASYFAILCYLGATAAVLGQDAAQGPRVRLGAPHAVTFDAPTSEPAGPVTRVEYVHHDPTPAPRPRSIPSRMPTGIEATAWNPGLRNVPGEPPLAPGVSPAAASAPPMAGPGTTLGTRVTHPGAPTYPVTYPSLPPAGAGSGNLQPVPQPLPQTRIVPAPHDPGEVVLDRGEVGWVRAEFGMWMLNGGRLPPLLTTSPIGSPVANAGALGTPGTALLIGNERVNDDPRSAGHLTLGRWLDRNQSVGIEASFFLTSAQSQTILAGSDGAAILARPFVDAATGQQAAQLISFPGLAAGNIIVDPRSSSLYGGNALALRVVHEDCVRRVSILAGYRYLNFEDELLVQQNLTTLGPVLFAPTFTTTDRFGARNEFHGGEFGLRTEVRRGRLGLEMLAKLALGNTHRRVDIAGSSVLTVPGVITLSSPGGLLALASNSGSYSSDRFSLVPELGATLSYELSPRWRATLGYTFLWWTNIVRANDQIDPVINTTLLPPAFPTGAARPAFILHDTDLLAHAIRAGLEYRY